MKERLIKIKSMPFSCFILGGIFGILIFWCYYGFRILPPTSDQWIYERSGDFVQHYIGWEFFRKTPWQFPFGLTEGISTNPVSVIYTDSIPLFAIIFKLISPILPATFQYMGIWGVFCFFMQGGLGALITRRFTDKISLCCICSIFFTTAYPVIQRMYGHTALAGQWIILVAILLWLYNDKISSIKRTVLWCLTATIAVTIHAYFVPMIFFIMCGALFYDLLANKKVLRNILTGLLSALLVLATMYCLGAFYGDSGDLNVGGLGSFSSNLNTFINPAGEINSCFLKPLPLVNDSQMEGSAYLGFGVIVGLIISFVNIIIWIIKNGVNGIKTVLVTRWQIILSVALVMSGTFFLAVMPILTFNDTIIFTLSYPDWLTSLLGIFRASGRFSWVILYLLIVIFIALNIKPLENIKLSYMTIIVCLTLQITDCSEKIKAYHANFIQPKQYVSQLQDQQWNSFGHEFKHIVFIPIGANYLDYSEMYYQFGEYALRYDMDLSSFVVARYNVKTLEEYSDDTIAKLQKGVIDNDTLYVFTDTTFEISSNNIITQTIDGYKICYSSNINGTP